MGNGVNDHEPISLAEARKHIRYRMGWRSLLNYLTAKELALGLKFIDRQRQRGRRRTRYRVTLAAIRAHAPEIVPGEPRTPTTGGLTVSQFKGALDVLDEKIADVTREELRREIHPRISALAGRVKALETKAEKRG